ncbi:hypothetical protein IWQ60_005074 [Tieghemiomyces parasiticus]|uniref:Phospholipid-transporting ATPase n=1 Tax=Tieghemiomyces parasiticus TaxID=78921 RepID=A0A9W8DYK4_9FUNG|nr:hypothetical protein IWQ60_005074 [Tieghemiomyces parasiticus]
MDALRRLTRRWRPAPRSTGAANPANQDDTEINITRIASRPEGATDRTVYVNLPLPREACDEHGQPRQVFTSNQIRTSKYTLATFIPKNLYEQFHRAANIYFLATAILQLIPVFGIDNPGLAILPICVVLFITAVKDGFEDYRRHISDNEFNGTTTTRLINWDNRNFGTVTGRYHRAKVVLGKILTFVGLGSLAPQLPVRIDHHAVYARRPGMLAHLGASLRSLPRLSGHHPDASRSEAVELNTLPTPRSSLGDDASSRRTSLAGRRSSLGDGASSRRRSSVGGRLRPRFAESVWQELYVGDIILLRNHDPVPADMILLSTSEDDGTCYIETMNLDGETNLKSRSCVPDTSHVQTAGDCSRLRAFVKSDPPSSNLGSHFATMTLYPDSLPATETGRAPSPLRDGATATAPATKVIPITINNMLLRGCVLRNTDFAIGMVLFTGPESKIMLNSGETPSKRSRVERLINYMVVINFVILVVVCLLLAVGAALTWRHWENENVPWITQTSSIGGTYVLTFWQTLILLQYVIPISLYVSLELVKTCQAFFIYQDLRMYYAPTDRTCVPRSWNLSDDLGQVQYVFSDKTGTLTRNVMEFRKCTIHGQVYGRQLPGDELDVERAGQSEWAPQTATKSMTEYSPDKEEDPTTLRGPDPVGGIVVEDDRHSSSSSLASYHSLALSDGLSDHGGLSPTPPHTTAAGSLHDTDKEDPPWSTADDARRRSLLAAYRGALYRVFTPHYVDVASDNSDAFSSVDPRLFDDLAHLPHEKAAEHGDLRATQARHVRDFFSLLAVCHTALVEKPERTQEDVERERGDVSDTESEPGSPTAEQDPLYAYTASSHPRHLAWSADPVAHGGSVRDSDLTQIDGPARPTRPVGSSSLPPTYTPINYRAESPDESALVKAAKNFGFTFLGRNKDQLSLDILGQPCTFTLLAVIEFNSTRKRMSVVVRRPAPWHDIVLCCKGADNVIVERLAPGQDDLRDATLEQIDAFSNQGLRVLCMASRVISEEEYADWGARYQAAQVQVEGREEELEACADLIERDLALLGATAIEDKLQEEVPATIAALRDAGIHVWVLTGDKLETAINIGFASSLITRDMEVWTIRRAEEDTVLDRFHLVANVILKQGLMSGAIDADYLDSQIQPRTRWQRAGRFFRFIFSGPRVNPQDPGSRGWFLNFGIGPSHRRSRRRHRHRRRMGDTLITENLPGQGGRHYRRRTTLRRLRTLFRNRRKLDHLRDKYGFDESTAVATSYHASRVNLRSQSRYSIDDLERGLSPDTRLSYCGTRRHRSATDDEPAQADKESDDSPTSDDADPDATTRPSRRRPYLDTGDEDILPPSDHALVIDGTALRYIMRSPVHARLLQQIAPACKSVICCRVSPLQKAQVVQLIRRGHDVVTLAIGDGANDVSMIQQADVGVAIAGEEGMQASMASDYAIARFRFLRNLLLVHGLWCYLRIVEMVLSFFYKNVIWAFGAFWYQFFDGYSANFLYDYSFFQLYNLIFTSLPALVLGVLDQAVPYDTALQFPGLYRVGVRGTHFSMRRFWLYQFDALWQSAVCFFVFYLAFRSGPPNQWGRDMGQFDMSTLMVYSIVIVANLYLALKSYTWNPIFLGSIALSFIVLYCYLPVYSAIKGHDLTGVAAVIYPTGIFWLGVLLATVISLFITWTMSYIGFTEFPEDLDVIRLAQKYRRPVSSHSTELGRAAGPSEADLLQNSTLHLQPYDTPNSATDPRKYLSTKPSPTLSK